MTFSSNNADFHPTASWETLTLRAALLDEVRSFFRGRGYLEVETPVVSRDVVVDAHLDPFVIRWGAGTSSGDLYLQTSPEFHMKRMLAAGAKAIFQVSRVMRHGEFGRLHNPEFTMIEWYRVGDTHREQMGCVEALVRQVFSRAAELRGVPDGTIARPFERLSYDEAFERHAGMRVLSLPAAALAALAERFGVTPPAGQAEDDRDGWLNLLLAIVVEPHLGRDAPTFLYDYPASQAALAKVRPGPPAVAERFELYWGGIEVCNGYHELTDANELRERMRTQAAIRRHNGSVSLPLDNRLLNAMDAGLPDCAGVALGFDRLVMLAAGKTTLAEVIAFPFDRA